MFPVTGQPWKELITPRLPYRALRITWKGTDGVTVGVTFMLLMLN